MPVYNQSWYNSNESRDYPLDDKASALADNGIRLPQNIIADLRLRYPLHLGNYPFISSVTVTLRAVTVTIQAATTLDNLDNSFVPLAVITVLLSDLDEGRQYALEPQYPGTFGYIVFGSGAQTPCTVRLPSPLQGLLSPRAAKGTRGLPVSSLAKLFNSAPLTGIVKLVGQSPIEIVKENREILGIDRDVIVVRLVSDTTAAQPTDDDSNVFRLFAGPCAKRPESRTCGDPQPIEFINSVAPDCDGVIELEFKGCAVVGKNLDDNGIVIDCGMGLTESCLPPAIPNAEGKLPSEYDPVVIPPPPDPEPVEPEPVDSVSDSIVIIGEFPYTDCFHDQQADDFITVSGSFVFAEDDSPEQICPDGEPIGVGDGSTSDSFPIPGEYSLASEGLQSASQRNVALWVGFDGTTLQRKVITDLKLLEGPSGAKRNGGIILNYRPHATITGRFVYYVAEIQYDTQEFQIQRFNGTTFTPVVSVNVPGLMLNKWYRITASVVPANSPSQVSIRAQLLGIDDNTISAGLGPILVSNYLPGDGHNGLGSNRAHTRFSFFRVEEFLG